MIGKNKISFINKENKRIKIYNNIKVKMNSVKS